jgi:hypothetical protein
MQSLIPDFISFKIIINSFQTKRHSDYVDNTYNTYVNTLNRDHNKQGSVIVINIQMANSRRKMQTTAHVNERRLGCLTIFILLLVIDLAKCRMISRENSLYDILLHR